MVFRISSDRAETRTRRRSVRWHRNRAMSIFPAHRRSKPSSSRVRAFERFPIIETLPALARNEIRATVSVEVPFADAAGVVARGLEDLGKSRGVGMEWNIVEKHAVRQRALAGEQRCPSRQANGKTRDRIDEMDAFPSKPVEVGCLDVRIAGKADRLRAPLIGEHDDDVWWFAAACGIGMRRGAGGEGETNPQSKEQTKRERPAEGRPWWKKRMHDDETSLVRAPRTGVTPVPPDARVFYRGKFRRFFAVLHGASLLAECPPKRREAC